MLMIHIAFISDDAYMFATGVAVSSIKQNRSLGTAYTIHVLCDRVSATKKEKLMRLRDADFEIDIVDVSGLADISVFFMKGFPVSPSAIYKFRLPQIFHGLNRIIYMDGDLIVRGDLTSLWEQDLDGFYVAAVSDRHAHFFKHKTLSERIGYPHADYFNSGVMLLNLELMRKDCVTEKLFDYRLNGRNDFMDQDALNVVLGVHARFLPLRFNTIATCVRYSDAEHLNRYYPDTHVSSREEACSSALIYHYASGAKPWKFANGDNRDVWLAEWRRSIYADEPIGNDVFAPEEERHRLDMQVVAERPVKVSVIIPVYNAQKYLEECIQSVLNQKGIPELEVICVDDGSVDNSVFVAYGRQFRDARVRVVSQRNAGAGVARNTALDIARGKYVLFQDSDDKMSGTTILHEAYAKAEALNLDVVDMEGCEISEEGRYLHPMRWLLRKEFLPKQEVFSRHDLGAGLFILTSGGPCAKLFRRSLIEREHLRFPVLRRSEDFPFVQTVMSLAERIGVLPKQILSRRIGLKTSLESTKDSTPLAFADAEAAFTKMMEGRSVYVEVRPAAALMSIIRLDYNLRAMQSADGVCTVFDYAKKAYPTLAAEEIPCDVPIYTEAKARMDAAMACPDVMSYLFARMKQFQRVADSMRRRLAESEARFKAMVADQTSLERTILRLRSRQAALQAKSMEVKALHNSEAYRVGMAVTWPARKTWGGVKCLRENGLKYTVKHAVGKVLRRLGFKCAW